MTQPDALPLEDETVDPVAENAPTDTLSLLEQAAGYALDYMSGIDDRPVYPEQDAIDALRAFDERVPDDPSDPGAVLAQLHGVGSPATVASTGGRYFGFVTGGCLPAPLAATWLAAAWDQNAGPWVLSPAAAEIETVAARWMLDLLDLPRDAAVGFVSGATMAGFSALAAARSAMMKRQGWDVRDYGLRAGPELRIVMGEETHPTIVKALTMLGFGRAEIDTVPTDDQGAIRADALPKLDEKTILLLQAGNVNSGACDPFTEILPRARDAGAWVHVDGAFGLWARTAASLQAQVAGVELADSWSVDAHKWLNVPYDSAIYACRDADAVHHAFGVDAPYLVKGRRREPNHFTPELSRRARGVEIWAAIKSLGRAGIAEMIERCCAHARTFAHELSAAGFEILNEVTLNQVCVRFKSDPATLAIMDAVQREGVCWLGPTTWKGQTAFRISVSSWATTDEDVAASVAALVTASRRFGSMD